MAQASPWGRKSRTHASTHARSELSIILSPASQGHLAFPTETIPMNPTMLSIQTTISLISLLCCIIPIHPTTQAEPNQAPPNILFLFADDQRADTIGAHGNPHIKTPHLDRMASEGFSFRRHYCAGSFSGAVCVASRAMLMTGRHWMHLPAQRPASNWGDATPLPALLSSSGGYQSFLIGKWHNGPHTLERSFSNGSSVYMGGMANHADFQVQDLKDGTLSPRRDAGGFSSTVFANDAIRFIEEAGSEKPFFLYVAFMAPHDPRNPPEAYRRMYYNNRPPLPANFLPQHPFQNAPQATSGRDEGLAAWPRSRETVGEQLCEYYGLVTHLDREVGRILEALDKSPHAANTLVVYTADHGLAMGSHGLLGKQNVYEQSMRSPLILRGPGIPHGQSSQALTYMHDLYATVCHAANVTPPEHVDAENLTPIIQQKVTSVRASLFLPFQDNQRSVRNARWKLHVYPRIHHQLLFDLESDPHEMHDLATDPAHQDVLAQMRTLMDAWRKRWGDPYPLHVANPSPKTPHYDNSQRRLDIWQPQWIRDKYFNGRNDPNHGNHRSAPLKPSK
jgi:arylsulfatase A-like enzyme